MTKTKSRSKQSDFNTYKSGQAVLKACLKSDRVEQIRMAKGSHAIVRTKSGQTMTFTLAKEIPTGLRRKIIKFMKLTGIIALLVLSLWLTSTTLVV